MKRCIVGLSGGVDSAVTALIMKQNGYHVIGCTLKIQNTENAMKAIYDALEIAKFLDIDIVVVDCVKNFKQYVIDYFINSYRNGITPNPCVICNDIIKFKYLNVIREQKNADLLATGHYARLIHEKPFTYLYQAKDKIRDQSYFLYAVSPEILSYTQFPLGEFTKEEVRNLARKIGLHVSEKSDSQDICFLQNKDYASLISEGYGINSKRDTRGIIRDVSGNILGKHKGIIHYTIGQRKGLDLPNGPFFVYKIDVINNEIIISRKDDIKIERLSLRNVRFINDIFQGNIYIKIRSSGKKIAAKIINSGSEWIVELSEPEYGAAKGQHCVFYDKEKILGGGEIC